MAGAYGTSQFDTKEKEDRPQSQPGKDLMAFDDDGHEISEEKRQDKTACNDKKKKLVPTVTTNTTNSGGAQVRKIASVATKTQKNENQIDQERPDSKASTTKLKPEREKAASAKSSDSANEDNDDRETWTSYIVFPSKTGKPDISEKDIKDYWPYHSKDIELEKCERLHPSFPNIWRLQTLTGKECKKSTNPEKVEVKQLEGLFYPRATCWFFDKIDGAATESKLTPAVEKELGSSSSNKKTIQINPQKRHALVIIASLKEIKLKSDKLQHDGCVFHHSDELSSSQESKIDQKPRKDSPSDDSHHQEQPVQRKDKVDNQEITRQNWYKNYSPTMPKDLKDWVLSQHQNVFRMKWNPQEFLEEFKSCSTREMRHFDAKMERETNDYRHFLRLTVMLNTYGIVQRGEYQINGRNIRLSDDKMKTIVYTQKSMLSRGGKVESLGKLKPKYESTKVFVVDEDCVVAYHNAVKEGLKPLLLNMANAYHPGGGYRRGDGAQEENIFRRSNYYRSLDKDFDFDRPTRERLFATRDATLKAISSTASMYPIDHHGAIYTEGLTFFRDTENRGYALLEKPLENVCAIAVSAYRDPKLIDNRLGPSEEVGTRKKIESVFTVGHHHEHDCLILSALGCGAFKNPPDHVAEIFESVIQQYAGFFKRIYFAIVDDHNTGKDFNPKGNYLPFKRLLHDKKYNYCKPTGENPVFGPHLVKKCEDEKSFVLSDIMISSPGKCRYGAQCYMINTEHEQQYFHPTLCQYSKSSKVCDRLKDKEHLIWFRHLKSSDPPSSIKRPLRRFDDDENDEEEISIKGEICPWSPFLCDAFTEFSENPGGKINSREIEDHCRQYLHFCRFGSSCTNQSDLHKKSTIHRKRLKCQNGENCRLKSNEEHLDCFSHPNIVDIRRVCRDFGDKCSQRENKEHLIKYRHRKDKISTNSIPIKNLNWEINFIENQQRMKDSMDRYIKEKRISFPTKISKELKEKIEQFQVIYKCSKLNLKIFLTIGFLLSKKDLKKLIEPSKMIHFVIDNKLLEKFGFRSSKSLVEKYFEILIKNSLKKISNSSISKELEDLERQLRKDSFDKERMEKVEEFANNLVKLCQRVESEGEKEENELDDSTIRVKFGNNINCRDDEIIIILKKEILNNFDSNISIRPECSFINEDIFKERPWTSKEKRENIFNQSKLHFGLIDFENIIARDLLLTFYKEKGSIEIDASRLMNFHKTLNYKKCYEGHLPSFIPLEYIEEVYSTDEIDRDLRSLTNEILKERIKLIGRHFTKDLFSIEVNKQIELNVEKWKDHRFHNFGLFFHVQPSEFKEFLTLPFDLDQMNRYSVENYPELSKSTDIYIYWQSFGGDLLMVLSNNSKIERDNKSLLCHIGRTPKRASGQFSEKKSYLHVGSPLKHENYLESSKCKTNENFHRCTNIENFLTYCLRLNKRDDKVTLSLAGANSIYNKEKVEIFVDEDSLNFDDLKFIHLSCGEEMVPIRNFVIRLSPIDRLHPKVERTESSSGEDTKDSIVRVGAAKLDVRALVDRYRGSGYIGADSSLGRSDLQTQRPSIHDKTPQRSSIYPKLDPSKTSGGRT